MSALQSGEPTPFPYHTRNLTPPQPLDFDEGILDDFDRQRATRETARRLAEIAKAQSQEAARWEQGSTERQLRQHEAAAHVADVIQLRVQTI